MRIFYFLLLASLIYGLGVVACASDNEENGSTEMSSEKENSPSDSLPKEEQLFCNANVRVGAERTETYFDKLEGKKIAVVGNQSSLLGEVHLVDSLMASGIEIVRVFSPEHGFRGDADAGEKIVDGVDEKTGLEVISLYGKNRKPSAEQLKDVDILLFDIQDVGARFYTYISTLHYVLQAAAESGKKVIVLDRPNPNGHYVDGPVLDPKFSSFVGMHTVPVVHGMTIGEYAQMVNGEGWLGDNLNCDLEVVSCEGWDHQSFYELPVAPSPNLPNMLSVYLYPSLCFFEGTIVSIGRGTDYPFQVIGHPDFEVDVLEDLYSFTPQPNAGASKPKLMGELCYGYDLHNSDIKSIREKAQLNLGYLIEFYNKLKKDGTFFLDTDFINLLAGTDQLKKDIIAEKSLEAIQESWKEEIDEFKKIRSKYLLYEDFE